MVFQSVCVCVLCVTFPWPNVVFHGFWVWPFGGRFLRKFPFAISAMSNPRVSKALFPLWPFRWPFCEFLTKTVTNLVGRHAHSSGPCPRVRLSRFAPAAEKTEKQKKTGSMIFVQNPLFFVQNPHAPSPKNFRSKPQNFRSKPRLRRVFGCSAAILHKTPETHSRPPADTEEPGRTK